MRKKSPETGGVNDRIEEGLRAYSLAPPRPGFRKELLDSLSLERKSLPFIRGLKWALGPAIPHSTLHRLVVAGCLMGCMAFFGVANLLDRQISAMVRTSASTSPAETVRVAHELPIQASPILLRPVRAPILAQYIRREEMDLLGMRDSQRWGGKG